MRLFFAFTWIFVAWRLGDWKEWRKYYPTMLYFVMSDLLYHFLTARYPLWKMEISFPLNHTFSVLVFDFIIMPCTVLVFLSNYPKGIRQVFYVLFYVMLYSGIEWFLHKLGSFSYSHGWNWYFSVLFNCVMFPTMQLHFKSPQLALLLLFIMTLFLMIVFRVPLPE